MYYETDLLPEPGRVFRVNERTICDKIAGKPQCPGILKQGDHPVIHHWLSRTGDRKPVAPHVSGLGQDIFPLCKSQNVGRIISLIRVTIHAIQITPAGQ